MYLQDLFRFEFFPDYLTVTLIPYLLIISDLKPMSVGEHLAQIGVVASEGWEIGVR